MAPDLVLGTGPGDLFITRNAGNVVPIASHDVDGVTATIEYVVEVLKVKSAILCGHSDCGALKAALDRKGLENMPKARRWLNHVEAGLADSGQCGGATVEPAGSACGGAGGCGGSDDGARMVLRHFERPD